MMRARLRCFALLCIAALSVPAQAQRVDPADAVTLALRNAVTFNPNGTQHVRLVALRALKDPAMQPMFEALLKADEAAKAEAAQRLDRVLAAARRPWEG